MPEMLIEDDFLPDFSRARHWADNAVFADKQSPVDGVVYPGICADIPQWLRDDIEAGITRMTGRRPEVHHLFSRLSTEGMKAPHQAHTDSSMGGYSLMVYLNRPEDCRGGTALVRHKATGMDSNPESYLEELVWKRDTNKPDAWEETQRCEMKSNRGCVFPAERMHRAEPVGGYGTDSKHGRLVMTAFFSL